MATPKKYDPKRIEKKWQSTWKKSGLYISKEKKGAKKSYVLDMFPYPSGDGLHVGHPKGYIATDVYSRHKRMQGFNVLHPMGWDAFGLPAENYAIKNKVHPRKAVEKNIKRFKEQLSIIGFNYDWSREINTTDPEYYKWTQWIFLKLYEKGLAYQSFEPINWCPSCQTGLANEDLEDGKCERCGSVVEKRPMRQWVLKITDYADRLLEDLNLLDWPDSIKESQKNWIGRSEGAEIKFKVKSEKPKVEDAEARSYVMGVGDIENDLKKAGINVAEKTGDGDYKITIPTTRLEEYEKLISEKLQPGFWNEYVSDEIVFIFKDQKGKISRHVWNESEESELLRLCREYANADFKSIRSMLEGNDWYSSGLTAHGSQLEASVKVFTTRPDTLYGATYLVLAPEHKLIEQLRIQNSKIKIQNWEEVESYINKVKNKSEIERTAEGKEKTGVELRGVKAVNPANGEEIPVWIADYVLAHYGTGAIMAVPAHDERDHEFAKEFKLPIRQVVEPKFVGETGDGAVAPELPFVRREAVCAIVRNPKDGTYLCNSWKTFHMHGLFTGGVEDGEDVVETARREVQEETGYKNLKHTGTSPIAINTFFYHRVKKQNRHAHFRFVFFDLVDDERDEVDTAEAAVHEAVWKTRKELDDFFTVFEGKFLLNLLDDPGYAHTGQGLLVNSGEFDGMESAEAKKAITEKVGGRLTTTYKLRDWVFSRQRYWGEPIPVMYCRTCWENPKSKTQIPKQDLKEGVDYVVIDGKEHVIVPVPEKDLPVKLPQVEHYEPTGTGESPLAAIEKWVNVKCPNCKGKARRETNTMPQWAGSSWYYLRYMDPANAKKLVDPAKERHWAPVDMYVGGAEHATRHLIYARFWHKFLYDIKAVSTPEPFARLHHVGLILAEDGRKMSKRYGNVVNPDDVVARFGADTLRVYEMFMGPFSQSISWSTDNMVGARRFIEKVWRIRDKVKKGKSVPDSNLEAALHRTIKKVGDDIEAFAFNTAISAMMILSNEMEKAESVPIKHYETLLKLLAPFAPHAAEELWADCGHSKSIHTEVWPGYDETKLRSLTSRIAFQVNGKVRAELEVGIDATEEEVKKAVLALPEAVKWLSAKDVKRVIFVRGRLINFVVA